MLFFYENCKAEFSFWKIICGESDYELGEMKGSYGHTTNHRCRNWEGAGGGAVKVCSPPPNILNIICVIDRNTRPCINYNCKTEDLMICKILCL